MLFGHSWPFLHPHRTGLSSPGRVRLVRGVALLIQKLACGIHEVSGHFLLSPVDSASPRPGSSSVGASVLKGVPSDSQVLKHQSHRQPRQSGDSVNRLDPIVLSDMLTRATLLSHVQLLETPWTLARQAPLSMGFSRQEYWSELPCPSPGDPPNPRISYVSCTGRQVLYH